MPYTKHRQCVKTCIDEFMDHVHPIKPAYVMDKTFNETDKHHLLKLADPMDKPHLTITHAAEPAAKAKCRAELTAAEEALNREGLPAISKDTIRTTPAPPMSRVSPVVAMPLRRRLKSESWDCASVFLMDIAGFTTICSSLTCSKITDMLQRFFRRVDIGLSIFNMVLVDIIGDAYLAINFTEVHYEKTVRFAIFCINAADKTLIDTDDPKRGTIQIRAAVHSGDLHSIVLETSPFRYTLIGPSLAAVKFLETEGRPGAVHCSSAVIALINQIDKIVPSIAESLVSNLIKQDNRLHARVSRTDSMQLTVSPFKILVLQESPTESVYSASIKSNQNTQTLLVQERRVLASNGSVVVCATTMRFLKISNAFNNAFGFDPGELRNFRMLCGPRTDTKECMAAFHDAFEMRKTKHVSTVLYNKKGDTVGFMGITFSYYNGSADSGVSISCCRIGT